MKKLLLTAASAVTTLVLPSCLQSETTVHLNKDGSGTLVEQTTLGGQAVAMMEQMAGLGGDKGEDPMKEMFSEKKAKEKAASYGEGVTFEKSEPVAVGANKGAKVTYRFADINKLKLNPNENLNDLSADMPTHDTASAKGKPVTFTYGGGKLTITMPEPEKPKDGEAAKPGKPEGAPDMDDPQSQAMMKQMLGDMKMSVKLVVEPGIAETDASFKDGKTITLMEMEMGKVFEKPESFKKLQAVPQGDTEAAMEAMKGIEGMKVETKKQVTVKLN